MGTYWLQVDDTASKMIKTQDNAKPRAYRAKAKIARLEARPEGYLMDDLKAPEEDVEAALKFDPNSGLATSQEAELILDRASLNLKQSGVTNDAWTLALKQGSEGVLALKPSDQTTQPATKPANGKTAIQPNALDLQVAAINEYLGQLNSARVSCLDAAYGKEQRPQGGRRDRRGWNMAGVSQALSRGRKASNDGFFKSRRTSRRRDHFRSQ